jgi:micrococcal nuclease
MARRRLDHIIAPDPSGVAQSDQMIDARIVRVCDGDGFSAEVRDPARGFWRGPLAFRFAFIDAPEAGQPYADEARDFLASLIAGKSLCLALIGKESSGYLPLDNYRRLLCMAFLTEGLEVGPITYLMDGKCGAGNARRARSVTRNIELEMVVNGWAWVLQRYSFDRENEYGAAEAKARRDRRGLWAMNNPEPSWKFKERLRRRRVGAEQQPGLL